jgi:hypothetical protein
MRAIPTGLTLDEHQAVAQTLQQLRTDTMALRRVILEGYGSGSDTYQSATKVVQAFQRLTSALLLAGCSEYEDRGTLAQLRRLYSHEPPSGVEDPS